MKKFFSKWNLKTHASFDLWLVLSIHFSFFSPSLVNRRQIRRNHVFILKWLILPHFFVRMIFIYQTNPVGIFFLSLSLQSLLRSTFVIVRCKTKGTSRFRQCISFFLEQNWFEIIPFVGWNILAPISSSSSQEQSQHLVWVLFRIFPYVFSLYNHQSRNTSLFVSF